VDTLTFLRTILPSNGLYIAARLTGKGFRNQVCTSLEELTQYVLAYDAQGVASYHACAAYREHSVDGVKDGKEIKQVRVQRNVRACKSFWTELDVDLADPRKFDSQAEACEALASFCATTGLPMPMVVSSGSGIHLYWVLTHDVQPEAWKQTSEGLKSLFTAVKFKASTERTADLASVLRPIGTWHRKDPNNPRPVELIADSSQIEYAAFDALVRAALKAQGVKPPEGIRRVEAPTETINQDFAVQRDFPPCSGIKVADRCKQLAVMRDTRGNMPEPAWYLGIQLLCSSIEGDALIHEWSNGYAAYSIEETNRKIAQVRGQSLGPTLCTTFESRNPGGCDGCPFAGKISSPAQLGTHVASAPAPTVEVQVADGPVTTVTLPLPPDPFTRGENGGIYTEVDGVTHKIYEYDAYPTELAYDEQLGYETMRIRHYLPKEGWKEFLVQSSLLARPVDFETKLRDQHVQPLIRNQIAMYFDSYLRKLRTDTTLRKLFRSQGWKNNDTEFVLGDKLYKKGEVISAGFSAGAKGFLTHFTAKGDIATWRDLTSVFQHPGFEPHAFMLLCAFAAPLLKLDNRKGFTVSALGTSGVGKSTMGQMLASVYGHPEDTWAKRDDTAAARMERIGAYYALPLYMDEITTISPADIRNLVYSIATGKGRDSLKQDRTVREGVTWATILITSTNDSLQSKLNLEKANAEAESLRLFEFKFPMVEDFGEVARLVPGVVFDHYGLAGPRYIQHVVNNLDVVRQGAHDAILAAEKSFGMDQKERFWSQAMGLALYGGKLAREIGVIDFDPDRIRPWLLSETKRMRKTLGDSYVGSVAILADFLNEHVGERLVATNLNAGMTAMNMRPMHELSQRFDKDTMTLWISRKRIKHYLDEGRMNYQDVVDDLMVKGILLSASTARTLGAGTDMTGGSTQCWKINASHPALGSMLADGGVGG
jgi:hypothetical protein